MRWILSWALYWTGDIISRIERIAPWSEPVCDALFDSYQAVMRWSERIQGDGNGPWEPPAK